MTGRMKFIICGVVAMLMLCNVMPPTAQAGTVTIYNKNCHKLKGFKYYKRVTVNIFNKFKGCTGYRVTVKQGRSKVVYLRELSTVDNGPCSSYAHEANGTVGGHYDAPADGHTHVTCKRDWADVCQCKKD